MAASKAMRIFTAVPVPALEHPPPRRTRRPRAGRAAATLMLACVGTLLCGVTSATVSAATPTPPPGHPTPTPEPTRTPKPTPSPSPPPSPSPSPSHPVVTPTPRPATVPPRVVTRPSPLLLPVPPPAPRPAPAATPPGGVEGIQAQKPGILPPVGLLPAPGQTTGAAGSVIPLGLLATFVATLLFATGLTARRRL